jgi:hypothetical protein
VRDGAADVEAVAAELVDRLRENLGRVTAGRQAGGEGVVVDADLMAELCDQLERPPQQRLVGQYGAVWRMK